MIFPLGVGCYYDTAPLGLLYPERSRVHPERSGVYPERSRGVGPYTGVLVSASLDEQFMSPAECTPSGAECTPSGAECTPSGAEGCFTFQVCALLFEDIFPLQDNSDSILLRVAKTYLHDEILWYARVHG